MDVSSAIARVVGREDLTEAEMALVIGAMMDGHVTPAQTGALLVALRMKGETAAEVVGAARAIRKRAVTIATSDAALLDTCGTGGDGASTINISTLAAIVVAAAGVKVAKHGNRALSSRAGSADLLEALGMKLAADAPAVERSLREVGIGFLFAPTFHGATRHAAAPRKEIGVRTIFNLLGPLTNPAAPRFQVVGVYKREVAALMAEALRALGSERALVVHGEGGLDEFAPRGATHVTELRDGRVSAHTVSPADFGLEDADPAGLLGGEPAKNAERARAILAGEKGAGRNCIVMTAAAALHTVGAHDLRGGARVAERLLDDGSAANLLARLIEFSHERNP